MDEYMDWNDQIQQDSSEFEVVPEACWIISIRQG